MKITNEDHEAIMRALTPVQVMLIAEVWDGATFKGTAIRDANGVREFLIATQTHPNFAIQVQAIEEFNKANASLAQGQNVADETPPKKARKQRKSAAKKKVK